MKYLILVLVSLVLVVHQLRAEEEKSIEEELKSRLKSVSEAGHSHSTKSRGHHETDLFINEDVARGEPSRIAKTADDKLASLFDGWNEKTLASEPTHSLLFGGLTWKYREDKPRIEFDTTLRKYLSLKDEYDVETTASFGVPYTFREKIELPSVLDCKLLTDKFTELRFDFRQNFAQYSLLEKQNQDQLICLLKGNSSFMMLDEQNYQKVINGSTQDLESVEYSLSSLETGDCLFVPNSLHYTVQTAGSWAMSISWHHFSQQVNKEDCKRSSSSLNNKLSGFIFRNDSNQKLLDLGVNSVPNLHSLISLLVNVEDGLKQKEFRQLVTRKILNLEKDDKCKTSCKETIAEVFKAININEDKLLSLEDLDYLDFERAQKIEKLAAEKLAKLKLSLKKPIDLSLSLDDIFNHIKQTAAKLEITQEVDKLLETLGNKFDQFKASLDEEKQKMIVNFDIGKFLNTLLNQLNKVSNIDGLLESMKGLNVAPVLAHGNVKKIVKDLLHRYETEKNTFLNALDFNSTLGFLLSQENLKGWNLNDLFGDSNMNRIVALMASLVDVNSFVDRLITGVGLLNMFGQMNLESTLDSINSDMLIDQVSRLNNNFAANLNGASAGADGRRAEREKHKERIKNKNPSNNKKEESIFDDGQSASSASTGEQDIEEISAYDDEEVVKQPTETTTIKKDQAHIVKEDL